MTKCLGEGQTYWPSLEDQPLRLLLSDKIVYTTTFYLFFINLINKMFNLFIHKVFFFLKQNLVLYSISTVYDGENVKKIRSSTFW